MCLSPQSDVLSLVYSWLLLLPSCCFVIFIVIIFFFFFRPGQSPSSVGFSSVQDGICVLGEVHMRSAPSLRTFPNVAFETVPMFV